LKPSSILNLRKYRVRILSFLNSLILFQNYSISYFFSRFGNNLQQIALGILFSNKVNGNFYLKNFSFMDDFSIINNPSHNLFSYLKKHYRFFYFSSEQDFPGGVLTKNFVYNNIEEVFKTEIAHRLTFNNDIEIDTGTLVIHIRSGDIFEIPINSYFQNPINYYRKIIEEFTDVLIVTSQDKNNPVCDELLKIDKVRLQTTSVENDFNTLANATNLATSGVGTFPIAAALVSNKLKNLYYTNLYSEEHLNPEMIVTNKVKHHIYKIDDNYIKKYKKALNFQKLILDEKVLVSKV
tara:strand:+ start:5770 stop:6651 length:882 start_codon:yes stop_codon:yes gene_type:complete